MTTPPEKPRQSSLILGDLEPAFDLVLYQLKRRLNFTSSAIFRYKNDEFSLFKETIHQPETMLHLVLMQLETSEYLTERLPVQVNDTQEYALLQEMRQQWTNSVLDDGLKKLRSWVALPVIDRNWLVGAITLGAPQPHAFLGADIQWARQVIEQTFLARQRLYTRLQGQIVQEERQRIARDLHDSINQVLYSIQLGASSAQTLLKQANNEEVTRQLAEIRHLAQAGLVEMRALLFELRPEALQTEGLVSGLTKLANMMKAWHNLQIAIYLGDEPDLLPEKKEGVYRIAQEALQNVVRHAQATRVELRFSHTNADLILEISDNGRGFDPADQVPLGHYGLLGMHERAIMLQAQLEIISQPGRGTQLRLTLPLLSQFDLSN